MNAFTKYIKRARNEAGLTQEQVAEHMGVSKVAVQNWEDRGIRRNG
ncbi:MAG: helix-turn-helix domain-containing protein [Coprococcus sp.]